MDRTKSANLIKFFGKAVSQIKKGKGIDYLKKFKDPVHNFDPSKVKGKVKVHDMQKAEAGLSPKGLSRGVRTSIGNTADSLDKLRKDVKGKGLLGGALQAGKNAYNLGKSQLKSDLYREVANPVVTRKGGKRFAKSK